MISIEVDAELSFFKKESPENPVKRILVRLGLRKGAGDSMAYSFGGYVSLILKTGATLLARRLVDPGAFGGMAFANAFLVYFQSGNSVCANAVARGVPQLDGAGKLQVSEKLISVGLMMLMLLVFLELLLFGTTAAVYDRGYYRWGFATAAVSALFAGLSNFDKHVLKSRNRFLRVARFDILTAVFWASSLVIFVLLWRETGYFLALMMGAVFSLLLSRLLVRGFSEGAFRPTWSPSLAKRVIALGGPMVGLGLVQKALSTIDRFFVEHYLGLEQLGLYSLNSMMITSALLLPALVAGSYLPKYLAFAGAGEEAKLKTQVVSLQRAVLYSAFLTVGLGVIFINPVLAILLPKYISLAEPLRLMLWNVLFLGLVQVAYFAHLGFGQMRIIILSALFGLCIGVILYWRWTPLGLMGVAMASVVSYVTYAITATISAQRIFNVPGLWSVNLQAIMLTAFLYAIYYVLGFWMSFAYFVVVGGWMIMELVKIAFNGKSEK